MYYKVITIIKNDFFLRVLNYMFLTCCSFSVFMTRQKVGKEKFYEIYILITVVKITAPFTNICFY